MTAEHATYDQLAAGFALSALEPEDELVFRAHLPGCDRCSEALLEHSTTMGHLAYAASSEEPPSSVLEGIRAGVRAARSEDLRPVEAPASLDAARARRAGRTVRLSTALVGIAASLIVAIGLGSVTGIVGGDSPPTQNAAFEKIVQQQLVPGARSIPLEGEGRAVAVINKDKVSLVVQGVSVNDQKSSVYVLWGKSRFGGVSAVGTFDVATSGPVVINDLGAVRASTLEALLVTKERGRKAPQVTTQQPFLAGNV